MSVSPVCIDAEKHCMSYQKNGILACEECEYNRWRVE